MKRPLQGVRPRFVVSILAFLVLFVVLGFRAFQLQVLRGEELKHLGERQHLKEWVLLPKRGTILDRDGEPLALSLEGQSVYVRPRRVKDPQVARSLAQALGLNASEVRQKLKSDKPFVWVKRQVTPKEAEKVASLNINGVGLSYEPTRYYPQGSVAGQVLGFVGLDSQGLEGVELHYDAHIRGETGSPVVERDALGRRVLAKGVEELKIPPGADIHMTLNTSFQHLAEKQLEAAVTKFRAKSGLVVIVEPFTGEVLAMANYPFFDPNKFTRLSSAQWRNRAVTDSHEPGSTFKTILAAAALEEGIVGREDLFYCEMGKYSYAGRTIHDTHEYGWLPFYKIIQHSSNIGATKVAEKLKRERYFKYIEKFGFGQLTGIDLPGEVSGQVRSPANWSAIDLATHSFGQGLAVTPIQLVMAYAAIANGGFLMRPFTVRRVIGPDGNVIAVNQPHVVRRVASERTAHLLTSILKGVVDDGGTGVMAGVEGFEVAGKTGTAQKPDLTHGGYEAKKRVASFIGFVPADDPRLVVLVLVDEPEVSVYGGVVAAPVFQNIARAALRQLNVAPETTELPPIAENIEQVPARIESRARNGTAPKAESSFEVPDFAGLSLREAAAKARLFKLTAEMRGHGYVVKQSLAPGAAFREGQKVILELQG
jgi:cell division protein FtsI (penicillin-binding protein 3)